MKPPFSFHPLFHLRFRPAETFPGLKQDRAVVKSFHPLAKDQGCDPSGLAISFQGECVEFLRERGDLCPDLFLRWKGPGCGTAADLQEPPCLSVLAILFIHCLDPLYLSASGWMLSLFLCIRASLLLVRQCNREENTVNGFFQTSASRIDGLNLPRTTDKQTTRQVQEDKVCILCQACAREGLER